MMRAVTYTEARRGLAELMDRVNGDAEEVLVTRRGRPSVVIVSEADWLAMVRRRGAVPGSEAPAGEAV